MLDLGLSIEEADVTMLEMQSELQLSRAMG